MHKALQNQKIKDYKMLSTGHGSLEDNHAYMPGFAPTDDRGYTVEVLGPVVEYDGNQKARLRRISPVPQPISSAAPSGRLAASISMKKSRTAVCPGSSL